MIWPTSRRPNAMFVQSDAGYRISITGVNDLTRFTAWDNKTRYDKYLRKTVCDRNCIGIFKTKDEAVQACEDHYNKQNEKAA